MEKTVYWVEYPDKDFAVMVIDDGESQEIATCHPSQRSDPEWPGILTSYYRRGFTVYPFTSWLWDNDGALSRHYRQWKRIKEDGTEGEHISPGPLVGVAPEGS